MLQAYSNDLRRKFFQVYDSGEESLEKVAERFRVSVSWAKKISARRTRTGQVEAPVWRRGPGSRVTEAMREWIGQQIRRQPDLTLQELQEQLAAAHRLRFSLGWLWVVLRQLGLRLKKSHSTPRSRTGRQRSSVGKHGSKRWRR